MTPSLSVDDFRDCRLLHTMLVGQRLLRNAAYRPTLSDAANFLLSKFGVAVLFAWRRFCAAFCDFISCIFQVRAQKEVRRVDAGRSVAVVADIKAVGDGTLRQNLGKSMRVDKPFSVPVLPVAARVYRPEPKPATALWPKAWGFVYAIPEPRLRGAQVFLFMLRKRAVSLSCAIMRRAQASRMNGSIAKSAGLFHEQDFAHMKAKSQLVVLA